MEVDVVRISNIHSSDFMQAYIIRIVGNITIFIVVVAVVAVVAGVVVMRRCSQQCTLQGNLFIMDMLLVDVCWYLGDNRIGAFYQFVSLLLVLFLQFHRYATASGLIEMLLVL